MTIDIGDIIMSRLSGLSFLDKTAGVVRTLSYNDVDKDKKVIKKTFPVACRAVFEDDCDNPNSRYYDLCPDDTKKSITYLEDKGINFVKEERHKQYYTAAFDLICWLNLPKIGYTDCSFSAQAIASIIKRVSIQPKNEGLYQTFSVQVQGQREKNYNPFLKYSYNLEKQQFLMYPFDHFTLSLQAEFAIDDRCLTEAEIGPPIECGSTS